MAQQQGIAAPKGFQHPRQHRAGVCSVAEHLHPITPLGQFDDVVHLCREANVPLNSGPDRDRTGLTAVK
jgi:hypothetical protein